MKLQRPKEGAKVFSATIVDNQFLLPLTTGITSYTSTLLGRNGMTLTHAADSTETEKKVRLDQADILYDQKSPAAIYVPSVELISSLSNEVVGGVEECPSDAAALNSEDPARYDATTESSDEEVHNEEV